MIVIISLLIVPIAVYCLRLALGERKELTGAIKVIRSIFIISALLLIVLILIENLNYYFVGYRSTSIVYLVATIAGIAYALADRRFILNSFKRVILNLVAVILMMGSSFLTVELLEDFNKQMVYSDSKFRLELSPLPMGPCGLPALFVKTGLLERKSHLLTAGDTCISKSDISAVKIIDVDTAYLVNYSFKSDTLKDLLHPLIVIYSKP